MEHPQHVGRGGLTEAGAAEGVHVEETVELGADGRKLGGGGLCGLQLDGEGCDLFKVGLDGVGVHVLDTIQEIGLGHEVGTHLVVGRTRDIL